MDKASKIIGLNSMKQYSRVVEPFLDVPLWKNTTVVTEVGVVRVAPNKKASPLSPHRPLGAARSTPPA